MPGVWPDSPESPPALSALERVRAWSRIAAALLITLVMVLPVVAFRLAGGSADRRITALWSRLLLRCLGIRLACEGTPIRTGMLAANHASWIDPLVIGAAAPAFFVAKSEVRSWPGVGWVCRLGRVEFVERRPAAVRGQVARIAYRLNRSQLLCVFPEGTSTDGLRILRFRSSLFASVFQRDCREEHAVVQPVAIRYRPDSGLPADFYGWWGDATFVAHMIDVAARSRRGTVSISFLDPVRASSESNRKTLVRKVEEGVAAGFENGVSRTRTPAAGVPNSAQGNPLP